MPILTIQSLTTLHSDVSTTKIRTHVPGKGGKGVVYLQGGGRGVRAEACLELVEMAPTVVHAQLAGSLGLQITNCKFN